MAKKISAASCGPCEMSAEDKKRQREWELENAARTLTRANEIRKDKKLMADLRTWAEAKAKLLKATVA